MTLLQSSNRSGPGTGQGPLPDFFFFFYHIFFVILEFCGYWKINKWENTKDMNIIALTMFFLLDTLFSNMRYVYLNLDESECHIAFSWYVIQTKYI